MCPPPPGGVGLSACRVLAPLLGPGPPCPTATEDLTALGWDYRRCLGTFSALTVMEKPQLSQTIITIIIPSGASLRYSSLPTENLCVSQTKQPRRP